MDNHIIYVYLYLSTFYYMHTYISLYLNLLDMSSAVMRHHGGDGGADPPRDPTHIEADCERGNSCTIYCFYS